MRRNAQTRWLAQRARITTIVVLAALLALPAGTADSLPGRQNGLSERQAAVHLLDRFGYGPRPGEVDRLLEIGLETWLDAQLDGRLAVRLRCFRARCDSPFNDIRGATLRGTFYNPCTEALGGWCLLRSSKPLSGAGFGVGGGFDSHAFPPLRRGNDSGIGSASSRASFEELTAFGCRATSVRLRTVRKPMRSG